MIKEHIKDFLRQEIYYGDKKANVSATNGGPLQCKEFMRWRKLQVVQEQDGSKTRSSKKRERTPVWPIHETVTVDLLLLKGIHKNHINAMIFLSKKFFLTTNFVEKNTTIHKGGPQLRINN